MYDLPTFKNKLYLPCILESLVFVKKNSTKYNLFCKIVRTKMEIGNALAKGVLCDYINLTIGLMM